MSPTLTTFLFQAANFLVLAAVLGWLFFKPVREAIERRRVALQHQVDEAAANLAAAEQQKSETQQRFATLEHELDEHRLQAHSAADQEAESILSAARDSARQEAEAAKQRLAHLERGQREHLARVIAEAAGASVDRLLRRIGEPSLDRALVTAACREIEGLDPNSLAPVRVESSHNLDDADRSALLAVLGPAAESTEFRVIENLGIGLRVATNCGLIDVSSAGLSTFAENLLNSHLTVDANAENTTDA